MSKSMRYYCPDKLTKNVLHRNMEILKKILCNIFCVVNGIWHLKKHFKIKTNNYCMRTLNQIIVLSPRFSGNLQAPFQYPIRRLIVRSREVTEPRDRQLKLSYRCEIWQARRQQCRGACQISERSDYSKYKSRGNETSRDFMIRRLIRYWNGALHGGRVHQGVRGRRRVSKINELWIGLRQLFSDVTKGQWCHILPRYANYLTWLRFSANQIGGFLIRSVPKPCLVRAPATVKLPHASGVNSSCFWFTCSRVYKRSTRWLPNTTLTILWYSKGICALLMEYINHWDPIILFDYRMLWMGVFTMQVNKRSATVNWQKW